ncbi:Zinc-type alcohol dehydrogenase C1773.06c-like protein 1 [Colletotrichum chlorophyti]|uniref:Zinc-type alcohol dehydrogenase C1773.06c-like protein 1 n=1 Tax=Colletotrichum chlorophyti TaxID=708187 RepID=A0A1Q8S261_9PEZI|nr:Zinc-type alcohol dehydrogenase C1773.06c-like protein 1 [Colletotrichum chlorophyti]
MSIPTTYTAFRRTTGELPRTIQTTTETLRADLKPRDVLIKIHAVSLNYRDVAMLNGTYPVEVEEQGIPCSDCAAEVVKTGSEVKDFSVGDHVSPIFDLGNIEKNDDAPAKALGGDVAGVLREYAVFEERHLVKIPKQLSWEEGSTLACAGVTAWTALDSLHAAAENGSVLLQGTGGVSLFALLLSVAAGLQAIVTSSSDEKIERLKKLSPRVEGINYKKTNDQLAEIQRLTNGRGVDFVVNNTGPGSIPDDIKALRARGGTVSLVGFLAGLQAAWPPAALMALMGKSAKLKGIAVGSKEDFQDLCQFLEEKKISLSPLIDRVFSFTESEEAFNYLYSGSHIGKVVIKM